jgi:hypothetical protein
LLGSWLTVLSKRALNGLFCFYICFPFLFMDTYTFKVRIGTLGSVGVQAASKWHAEDIVWIGLQAGKYAPLTAKSLTRKDISVA